MGRAIVMAFAGYSPKREELDWWELADESSYPKRTHKRESAVRFVVSAVDSF